MTDKLKDIYQENIQWLNFAELKNGVLLAIMGVVLEVVGSQNIFNEIMKLGLIIFCAIIMIVCAMSFVPFINSNKYIVKITKKYYQWKGYKDAKEQQNIIFYVNIFLSQCNGYKEAVCNSLSVNIDDLENIDNNYIDQVIAISTISSVKYFLFSIGINLFMFLLLIFCLLIIIA